MDSANKIEFPADIVFKALIKNTDEATQETIKNILVQKNLKPFITKKESAKGNFVSYTVAARFPSNELLQNVCNEISAIEGFMSLF